LAKRRSCYVIEGDQQTSNDADRIRETGAPAFRSTPARAVTSMAHGWSCGRARWPFGRRICLFIENVGNLVCPAAFDLGEAFKVAILSVTEGEDKPLKYPDMFAAADVIVLNKTDLLPYVDFDVGIAIENARRINQDIKVLQVSARSGDGLKTGSTGSAPPAQSASPDIRN
jgi:hydrogenase nickel incorporation protein HypB